MTTTLNLAANLRAINSLTKYPSIPTYHGLDPKNGNLLPEVTEFSGTVVGTEKVDGTNGRLIICPDGRYLLGSREHLLYAEGDLIGDPAQGIVNALRPVGDDLDTPYMSRGRFVVFYMELYGGKVAAASKHYTRDPKRVGMRLFDVATIDDYDEKLAWPSERISRWREAGGQDFHAEFELPRWADEIGVPLVPRLFEVDAAELPTAIEDVPPWMTSHLPQTRVALDGATPGLAEGIVLRSLDRSVIAKARFEDYARTLRRKKASR
ncbi:MAG TPA: RNA ligase family protein [Rugosimonospora sp.]|nr:RNA ligase family protein [Rugosimonospora sp.]